MILRPTITMLCALALAIPGEAGYDADFHEKCLKPTVCVTSIASQSNGTGVIIGVQKVADGRYVHLVLSVAHVMPWSDPVPLQTPEEEDPALPKGDLGPALPLPSEFQMLGDVPPEPAPPEQTDSARQDLSERGLVPPEWDILPPAIILKISTAIYAPGTSDITEVKTYDAYCIYRNDGSDVALVTFEAETPYPAAEMAEDTALYVGDEIVCVGSSFAERYRPMWGRVTGTKDSADKAPAMKGTIRTTVHLTPGDSGGPAFRVSDHKLIGINEAIKSQSINGTLVPAPISFLIPIERYRSGKPGEIIGQ